MRTLAGLAVVLGLLLVVGSARAQDQPSPSPIPPPTQIDLKPMPTPPAPATVMPPGTVVQGERVQPAGRRGFLRRWRERDRRVMSRRY